MKTESRAYIKATLLELLADCDQTTSDIIIKRVHPIVKQLVQHEFEQQKNQLMMEVAVMLGKIIGGKPQPLWESTPESLGLSAEDLSQEFGRKK